jgi:transcriptional regulator GlxA family with amidase domain
MSSECRLGICLRAAEQVSLGSSDPALLNARHISDGRRAVHELARDTGFSRRHFGERFMSEFGIAPKAAARVFRFEHACRMFLRSRRRIADVAVASGFHDQAHMVREWHALARLLTP